MSEQLDQTYSKKRLRNEINNHVDEFLKRGGRIEVVSNNNTASTSPNGTGHWATGLEGLYDTLPYEED